MPTDSSSYVDDIAYLEKLSVNTFGASGQIANFDALERAMNVPPALNYQERQVIRERYRNARTLQETGTLVAGRQARSRAGITKERVRQIEAIARRKLRHPSRRDVLRGGQDG